MPTTATERGSPMYYQATFTHACGGQVIESTVKITSQRRHAQSADRGEWSTARLGRLVLALRVKLLNDATVDRDGDLTARLVVGGTLSGRN